MAKLKEKYNCSLDLTLDLLGGKWKLRILWHIIHGDNRFSILSKKIEGITEKMLTVQLRELENFGLINRKVICEKPLKVEYFLSSEYVKIERIIEDLCEFSLDYSKINNININD